MRLGLGKFMELIEHLGLRVYVTSTGEDKTKDNWILYQKY